MEITTEMFVAVEEAATTLWSEAVMFALAAFFYMIFTRSVKVRGPMTISKNTKKVQEGCVPAHRKANVVTKSPVTCHETPRVHIKSLEKELEDLPQMYTPIFHMSKAGESCGALRAMAQLPQELLDALPPRVATKVLLCLCKSEALSEEVMQHFVQHASSFDCKIFESAAAEASRWRHIQACRQLYHLAKVACVQPSEKTLALLVRGHQKDSAAMQQMVEDLLADGSGVQLTRTLAASLMAQCTSADDQATLKMIQQQAEQRNVAQDISREARLISNLGQEGKLQDALVIFNRLATLDATAYNSLLNACINCQDFSLAQMYFKDMKERCLVDVYSYNAMIKGYVAEGNPVAARKMLSDMVQRGMVPTLSSYHILMNCMVQRGDCKAALALVDEMTASGLGVSAITWSILLRAARNRSQSKELCQIVERMNSSKVCMDETLFASVVDSCIRSGCLKLLWNELECLWRKDVAGVAISSATYGSMMKAYGQARDVPKVKQLWSKHCQDNVHLTPITLGCMVEALVVNGLHEDALAIVGQLWEDPEQRKVVNTVTYSTIMKGFATTRQHDMVLTIYKQMKDRQIECNSITYNTMINSLARCGMMHEVPQMLEDMKASSPPVEPDIVTFSTIIKGYSMSGDIDKALDFFVHMKATTSLQADEVLYNSLLNGCAKQGRLEEALGLLREMRELQVPSSNYTLSIICKLFGRARRLQEAFSAVESISTSNGFRPNIEVYTSLMQACFHNRQCQRALSLHDEIVSEGYCCPDEKTYTVIVRGCLHSKVIDKAIDIVRCAFHLPGHRMQQTQGAPPGIEMACIDEVMAQLGHTSASGKALIADLKSHCGITLGETPVYTRRYGPRAGHQV